MLFVFAGKKVASCQFKPSTIDGQSTLGQSVALVRAARVDRHQDSKAAQVHCQRSKSQGSKHLLLLAMTRLPAVSSNIAKQSQVQAGAS